MKKYITAITISICILVSTSTSTLASNTVNTATGNYTIENKNSTYSPVEYPSIKISGTTSFGQSFLKFITSIFNNTQNSVEIKNPKGEIVFSQQITNEQKEIKIEKDLIPGKYNILINKETVDSFSWGVLAINPNKDVYKTEETAKISIAVLDSYGQMVCDSNVELTIKKPNGGIDTLKTETGDIIVNKDVCNSTSFTLEADYFTNYKLVEEGTFELTLKTSGSYGQWEIKDSLIVDNNSPFSIERISPTRLYPLNKYPMVVKIDSNGKNIEGYKIVENYPSKYQITDDDINIFNLELSSNPEKQTSRNFIISNSGDDYSYYYIFDPPNISPDLFIHQPLEIHDLNGNLVYKEKRSFLVANDATNVTATYMNSSGNWTAPSGVSSVSVEAWGGGGGGAGATATTVYAQAGGGGGAYSKLNTYSVTAGNTYAYSAGAGGTRGTGAGGTGGDSNFINTSTLLAKGGTGGNGDTAGTGGASGSGVGDTTYTGGNGAAGTASATAGGAGGGAAGTNGNGSAGSTSTGGTAGTEGGRGANSSVTTEQNGLGGQNQGGGGSGGYVPDGTDHSGGVGGSGAVKISYSTPSNAPTLVGVGAQSTGTGTSLSPALPSGVASGDLLLIFVVHRADTNPTYTISGYTQRAVQYYNVGTGDLDMEMWYKIAGGSEGNPSITASTGTNGWSAQMAAYRGVDTTNPFDIASAVTGTNVAAETITPTGVTTLSTYATAISMVATYDDNNLTLSTSTGFDNRMDYISYTTTTGSDHSFAMADSTVPTAGSVTFPTWRQTLDTGTGTTLTYDQWVYISDAINPINNTPSLPTLDSPTDTQTNRPLAPTLLTTASDLDADYLRYRINLCENVGMSTNCQTFDQTSSQTGWSGQNTQTSTAYTSGTQATYTVQSNLTANTTYYWKSEAKDPGGANTWSATQTTPYSFTTTTAPTAPATPYAEGATNPTGIIDLTPEFSAVHSDSNSDNANYYEIEVNTANDFSGTVMWDTGQTSMSALASGARSTDVSYAGTALSYNGTTYYWRIRFWDVNGAVSSWSTVQNFSTNSSVATPSLDAPTNTATGQSLTPALLTTTTDANSDYLRYKIELCENVGMSTNCQTFDQTSSQTGWSGQNTQTSTAYTSGTQATYTVQSALTDNFTYYWRSYAIDPAGTNTWSSTQGTPYSFTTAPLPTYDFDFKGLNISGITIE